MAAGRRGLVLALSLMAVVSSGCSKKEDLTKDRILSRAHDALAVGQWVRAEKDYREVLRRVGNDPEALRQLGALYFDQGQMIQAYPLLKQAAEFQPETQNYNSSSARPL